MMNSKEIEVGSRVAYHGRWPWHIYYGRVIAIDPAYEELPGYHARPAWVVEWEGDLYDGERAGKISRVPQYMSPEAFHAVQEVK